MKISLLNKMTILFLLVSLFTPTPLFATETYFATITKGDKESLNKFILDALAKRLKSTLGIEIKYRNATFGRNLMLMREGASDLSVFLARNLEREAYLYYIEPSLINMNVTFLVRKGEHTRIKNYEDLYGLRIGAFRNGNFFPRFNQDKQLNKSDILSLQQGINKLILNRLDAVAIPEHIASYEIWKSDLEDKIELSDYLHSGSNPMYIVLSKKAPIMQRLNQIELIITDMLKSGEIRKLIEQFYKQNNLPVPQL